MTIMTCSAVQRRLQSFHDRELPVGETIAVEHHIATCPPCARDLRQVQRLGDALRLAAAPCPSDDWAGVQAGVISRMRAEANQSWAAHARRFVDDLHLVWIGFASAAATVVCAGTVLSMLQVAPEPVRADSLATMLAVMGAPGGSDLNPASLDGRNPLFGGPMRVQAPSVPHDGVVYATLENALSSEEERLLPMSASVTSEGHVSELRSLLGEDIDDEAVRDLILKLSAGRLEPAQYGGDPVAVNYIWVVAHTTVKGVKGKT
jgi:anti-sigma factor RsiW